MLIFLVVFVTVVEVPALALLGVWFVVPAAGRVKSRCVGPRPAVWPGGLTSAVLAGMVPMPLLSAVVAGEEQARRGKCKLKFCSLLPSPFGRGAGGEGFGKSRKKGKASFSCNSPHPSPLRAPTEGWSGEGTFSLCIFRFAVSRFVINTTSSPQPPSPWAAGTCEKSILRST